MSTHRCLRTGLQVPGDGNAQAESVGSSLPLRDHIVSTKEKNLLGYKPIGDISAPLDLSNVQATVNSFQPRTIERTDAKRTHAAHVATSPVPDGDDLYEAPGEARNAANAPLAGSTSNDSDLYESPSGVAVATTTVIDGDDLYDAPGEARNAAKAPLAGSTKDFSEPPGGNISIW